MLESVKRFIYEEDGLSTVEIVVIVAILVGLALVFRRQIFSLIDQIFDRIFKDAGETTNRQDITTKPLGT